MRLLSIMLILALASSAMPVHALTDEEIFRNFRFNLVNPGARSLALGGAFLSLADDATAAQANPAGLAFFTRSEYFVELRSVDNGAVSSTINETLPGGIDTYVATGTNLDDTISPSFVSVVTHYGDWAMGLSRQELLKVNNSTVSSFAFTFPDSPGAFLADGVGSIDVNITNINVSVGAHLNKYWALGGTLTYSRLDVLSQVTNTVVDTGGNIAGREILEPTLDLRTSINDHDHDVVFSLGVIRKSKKPNKWSLGAVFRRAPRFNIIERIDPAGPDGDSDGFPDSSLDLFQVRDRLSTAFINRFNLPDFLAIGGSYQISDRLMLAMDIERIKYSNLMDGYTAGVNILTTEESEFTIDDGTDVRTGAEYILFNENNPLPFMAVRAGVFKESDSTIRALSTGESSFATAEAFRGRGDQFHTALGVGFIWDRLRIDCGADFSETDNEYLLSVIYLGKK